MESWENTCNVAGWGPPQNFLGKEFEGFLFSGVTKPERLGKFFDIFSAPTAVPGTGSKRRPKDPVPAAAPKEDDKGFVIVESKAVSKAKKKGTTYTRRQPAPQQPTYRQDYRQTRGGKKPYYYQPAYVPRVMREPSINLTKEWELVTEFTKQKLEKLSFRPTDEREILKTGAICKYNDKYDYVTPRQPMQLKIDENIGLYNWATTIENTFVNIIQTHQELNVFASDAVIATLMTAPLSVYPWDISVEKRNGKIILDCNERRIFDYTTVFESATVPPEEDHRKKEGSVNGPKKLGWEATMSNHYFGQQALVPGTASVLGPDPGFKLPEKKEKPKKGYIYKSWKLEKNITLCVRCQVDAYLKAIKAEDKKKMDEEKEKDSKKERRKAEAEQKEEAKKPASEAAPATATAAAPEAPAAKATVPAAEEEKDYLEKVNLRAVNEYYETKRQMNWKQMFDNNRSMLISEVSTNDAIKLTKWTIEALLGGVENIRIAYLARKKLDDNKKHDIIGVSRFTTKELESLVNLNFDYTWGVLKMIIKSIHEQEDGSYYLVKDPNRFIIRLYKKVKIVEEDIS